MPKIILYTSMHCVKCPEAKKILKEVVAELNLKDYEIKNVDDEDVMIEALQHQVAATPSLIIDNELIYNGEIPDKNELIEILKTKIMEEKQKKNY